MQTSRTIAIIPARGGSKAIPRKNLIDFAGKPLLAWSILQARASDSIDEVFVSSDSSEILDAAAQYGASPILRPDSFSTDTASSESAVLHVLETQKKKHGVDPGTVVFLQATSPLRAPGDIDGAVEAYRGAGADSLFSDAVLDDLCVWHQEDGVLKGKTFDPVNRGRRQDRAPLYLENGSIYVFSPALLRKTGNRLGGNIARFTMDFWKSFEIDTMESVDLCEYYFRKHLSGYWKLREATGSMSEASLKPELIVYDFDGVMTDNRVLVSEDGTESVLANRADGWGIGLLRNSGYRQIILSTETNRVVAVRAKKLGLEVLQGSRDKLADLSAYCDSHQIGLERVLYVGNDVNDIEVMGRVGFPVAPADAHPTVLALAKHVTNARGGEGVIKEISERLLATASK